MNQACREKDDTKIEVVGSFAAAIAEILQYQERNRADCLAENFKVYRGLTLPQNEIDGYMYVA